MTQTQWELLQSANRLLRDADELNYKIEQMTRDMKPRLDLLSADLVALRCQVYGMLPAKIRAGRNGSCPDLDKAY